MFAGTSSEVCWSCTISSCRLAEQMNKTLHILRIREQKYATADRGLKNITWIVHDSIGNCQQVLEILRFLFSIDAKSETVWSSQAGVRALWLSFWMILEGNLSASTAEEYYVLLCVSTLLHITKLCTKHAQIGEIPPISDWLQATARIPLKVPCLQTTNDGQHTQTRIAYVMSMCSYILLCIAF